MNKLNKQDLINIGIYTAIYFVIVLAIAMLGMIPVFMPLLSVLVPLIGAIPFVMYLSKIRKSGMIFITSIIMGLMMLLTGMGFYSLIISVFTGLIAEAVWKKGNYISVSRIAPTYAVFSLWIIGNYLPYYLNKASYIAARSSYGEAYWASLDRMMPGWMLPVFALLCFASGWIGAKSAVKILGKKLKKAGMNES